MQTPAEKYLIRNVRAQLAANRDPGPPRILNIGAGKSVILETQISSPDYQFVCDRVDVIDCEVDFPCTGRCFRASVEAMPEIDSGSYRLAFANYVLEHVADLDRAAKEIYRVLQPQGHFVLSLPNPSAPEFRLSRHTPLWFHQLVKGKGEGKTAFETHYAYRSIRELIGVLARNDFALIDIEYYPFTLGYLYKFPVLKGLSRGYDALVARLGAHGLMGNVGIVFQKRT